ncbi:DMT family transporter [Pseudovibrio exalbescens]|uniref:DMT family transporter n=2 Tax=Stappiaceae TaxID=2821832 RepID=UPI002365A4F7|nr:DMT family transporter [Pseudovibrio exalbescens]MDD7910392.1 DMT family transporter [Pseudovibrio exalbescens]
MRFLKTDPHFRAPKPKMPPDALPPATGEDARPLIGIAFKVASTFSFFIMVSAIKLVSEDVPITQVVFARNFFGMIPILIMMIVNGQLIIAAKTNRPGTHISRAVIGVTAMVCNFWALSLIPLPDATAIGFAAPLIVVVLAALVLKETVRIFRWSAVAVGFVGVIITVLPHMGQGSGDTFSQNLGVLLAFGAAFFGAVAMITVRKLCETERTSTIVFWFTMASTGMSFLTLPLGWVYPDVAWVMPSWLDMLFLVGVGVFGGIGQLLLTQSYRFADASTVAPFDYINMVWAIVFGFLIFAEVPTPEVLVGSAIVISAGIFVIYRERKLGFERTRPGRASTPSKS